MSIALVNLETYRIDSVYISDDVISFGMPWDDPQKYGHYRVPQGLREDAIKAVYDADTNEIIIITDEELYTLRVKEALDILRRDRNQRLLQSDWTQLPRGPLTDEQKDAWEAYRQALRDLPSTLTEDAILHPDTITWPAKPQ